MTRMPHILNLLAAGLLTLTFTGSAIAQSNESKPTDAKSTESGSPETHARSWICDTQRNPHNDCVLKTYFLNTPQQNDANEILIALRNVLDSSNKMYLVVSRRAIEVYGPPEQQALAQQIVSELDRPEKTYRLTFTIADSDNGKRVGIQHVSMIVAAGQRTTLKQGDKIPVATGTYGKGSDPQQTQFQYLDVGINLDATLEDTPSGLQLKSKIEQSSVGVPSTIAGVQEPVFRQTVVEGTSRLSPNKPLTLGSADVTGTTRHIDVEVVAEPAS